MKVADRPAFAGAPGLAASEFRLEQLKDRPGRFRLAGDGVNKRIEGIHRSRGHHTGGAVAPCCGHRQGHAATSAFFGRKRVAEHAQIIIVVERSEEHTSELQSLMRTSYAVFCMKKKKQTQH